ncbi:hypothetical protein GE21DRAFT_1040558 [Neurospora crassa]|nr:hypothetical protein GE21DRAFT_1040558 [Neurospora crassa]
MASSPTLLASIVVSFFEFPSAAEHLDGWMAGTARLVTAASPEVLLLQNLEPNGVRGRGGSKRVSGKTSSFNTRLSAV